MKNSVSKETSEGSDALSTVAASICENGYNSDVFESLVERVQPTECVDPIKVLNLLFECSGFPKNLYEEQDMQTYPNGMLVSCALLRAQDMGATVFGSSPLCVSGVAKLQKDMESQLGSFYQLGKRTELKNALKLSDFMSIDPAEDKLISKLGSQAQFLEAYAKSDSMYKVMIETPYTKALSNKYMNLQRSLQILMTNYFNTHDYSELRSLLDLAESLCSSTERSLRYTGVHVFKAIVAHAQVSKRVDGQQLVGTSSENIKEFIGILHSIWVPKLQSLLTDPYWLIVVECIRLMSPLCNVLSAKRASSVINKNNVMRDVYWDFASLVNTNLMDLLSKNIWVYKLAYLEQLLDDPVIHGHNCFADSLLMLKNEELLSKFVLDTNPLVSLQAATVLIGGDHGSDTSPGQLGAVIDLCCIVNYHCTLEVLVKYVMDHGFSYEVTEETAPDLQLTVFLGFWKQHVHGEFRSENSVNLIKAFWYVLSLFHKHWSNVIDFVAEMVNPVACESERACNAWLYETEMFNILLHILQGCFTANRYQHTTTGLWENKVSQPSSAAYTSANKMMRTIVLLFQFNRNNYYEITRVPIAGILCEYQDKCSSMMRDRLDKHIMSAGHALVIQYELEKASDQTGYVFESMYLSNLHCLLNICYEFISIPPQSGDENDDTIEVDEGQNLSMLELYAWIENHIMSERNASCIHDLAYKVCEEMGKRQGNAVGRTSISYKLCQRGISLTAAIEKAITLRHNAQIAIDTWGNGSGLPIEVHGDELWERICTGTLGIAAAAGLVFDSELSLYLPYIRERYTEPLDWNTLEKLYGLLRHARLFLLSTHYADPLVLCTTTKIMNTITLNLMFHWEAVAVNLEDLCDVPPENVYENEQFKALGNFSISFKDLVLVSSQYLQDIHTLIGRSIECRTPLSSSIIMLGSQFLYYLQNMYFINCLTPSFLKLCNCANSSAVRSAANDSSTLMSCPGIPSAIYGFLNSLSALALEQPDVEPRGEDETMTDVPTGSLLTVMQHQLDSKLEQELNGYHLRRFMKTEIVDVNSLERLSPSYVNNQLLAEACLINLLRIAITTLNPELLVECHVGILLLSFMNERNERLASMGTHFVMNVVKCDMRIHGSSKIPKQVGESLLMSILIDYIAQTLRRDASEKVAEELICSVFAKLHSRVPKTYLSKLSVSWHGAWMGRAVKMSLDDDEPRILGLLAQFLAKMTPVKWTKSFHSILFRVQHEKVYGEKSVTEDWRNAYYQLWMAFASGVSMSLLKSI